MYVYARNESLTHTHVLIVGKHVHTCTDSGKTCTYMYSCVQVKLRITSEYYLLCRNTQSPVCIVMCIASLFHVQFTLS